MEKKINGATRLRSILEKAAASSEKGSVLDGWARVLSVGELPPVGRAIAVTNLLHALFGEIQVVEKQLSDTGFSKELYQNAFGRVQSAISPMLLPTPWTNVKQYLSPEVLLAVAFCGEILPGEELLISDEEFKNIQAKLAELKESLVEPDIPPRLAALVRHHIDLINAALSEYGILGAKVLREAGRTALGEIIEVRDEIAPAKGTQVVDKLAVVWQTLNSIVDVALKAEKVGALGQKVWDVISQMGN